MSFKHAVQQARTSFHFLDPSTSQFSVLFPELSERVASNQMQPHQAHRAAYGVFTKIARAEKQRRWSHLHDLTAEVLAHETLIRFEERGLGEKFERNRGCSGEAFIAGVTHLTALELIRPRHIRTTSLLTDFEDHEQRSPLELASIRNLVEVALERLSEFPHEVQVAIQLKYGNQDGDSALSQLSGTAVCRCRGLRRLRGSFSDGDIP